MDKLKQYFKIYDVQGTDPESTMYLWKGDYPGMLKSLDEKYKSSISENEDWLRLANALEKIRQTLEARYLQSNLTPPRLSCWRHLYGALALALAHMFLSYNLTVASHIRIEPLFPSVLFPCLASRWLDLRAPLMAFLSRTTFTCYIALLAFTARRVP